MARRRQRDRGPVYDAFRIYRVHPIVGPAIAAIVIWGGLGFVLPAILTAMSHAAQPAATGSQPSAATINSADAAALGSATYAGLAQGLVWLAPLFTVVLVAVPAAFAWTAILWDRGPWARRPMGSGRPRAQRPRTR